MTLFRDLFLQFVISNLFEHIIHLESIFFLILSEEIMIQNSVSNMQNLHQYNVTREELRKAFPSIESFYYFLTETKKYHLTSSKTNQE